MAMCVALTLQLNCWYSLLPMYNYKTLNHERNQFLLNIQPTKIYAFI